MKIEIRDGLFAEVDDADEAMVGGYSWHLHVTPTGKMYARTTIRVHGKKKWLWMHRLILGLPHGKITDHRDGNGLNNERSNLRESTYVNNARSMRARPHSSKYKGVTWRKRDQKWYAQIELTGRRSVFLGSFSSQTEAAMAYDAAAKKHFGEHALTNGCK